MRPANVSAGERRRLAMAIRAEHSQVREAPIIINAIDMVDVNNEWLAAPLSNATSAAFVLEQVQLQ